MVFIISIWSPALLLLQGTEDDSDDEYDDEAEETALESYQTPLDADDCPIDEYQVFTNIIRSKLMIVGKDCRDSLQRSLCILT